MAVRTDRQNNTCLRNDQREGKEEEGEFGRAVESAIGQIDDLVPSIYYVTFPSIVFFFNYNRLLVRIDGIIPVFEMTKGKEKKKKENSGELWNPLSDKLTTLYLQNITLFKLSILLFDLVGRNKEVNERVVLIISVPGDRLDIIQCINWITIVAVFVASCTY